MYCGIFTMYVLHAFKTLYGYHSEYVHASAIWFYPLSLFMRFIHVDVYSFTSLNLTVVTIDIPVDEYVSLFIFLCIDM